MHPWKVAAAVLLFASACAAAPEQRDHNLLSTTLLARDIGKLPDAIRTLKRLNEPGLVNASFVKVQHQISKFIIHQVETYPSISACELQKQLATAFSIKDSRCGDWQFSDSPVPRVFANAWGPESNRRVFVVTYCIWLGFYGEDGYQTVLESYIWELGRRVRLGANVVPAAFSGMMTDMEQVSWFPGADMCWVLMSGTMSGASGRALSGTAAVFEIGPEGGKQVWSTPPLIGNVRAHAHASELRWEIEYVDIRLFYDGQPKATLLDIYQIDWGARTYHRLVHVPLD